jgi:aminoglycoside phosphotransferase (APT) family kinase protein
MAAMATFAVPGLDIVGVRADRAGADYSFAIAEDAQGCFWVVRVPLSAAAGARQEAEIVLLRSLAAASASGTLPFEVPRPRGFAPLDNGGRAMVYPALPGVPVIMELLEPGPGLATSIGRALARLHDLPTSLVEEVGLPSYAPGEYRRRIRSEVDDAAGTGYVTVRLIDRWLERLEQEELWVFEPAVIHGDMAPDHLFEEHGRVSAVLDFSTVQVSDPAEDLAPMMAAATPEVADTILDAYRVHRGELADPHLSTRAEFLSELAVSRWLLYGVRHGDGAIVTDARSMLVDLDKAVAEQEHQAELARIEAERKAHEAAERHAAAERASIRADRETAERRAIHDAAETSLIPGPPVPTASPEPAAGPVPAASPPGGAARRILPKGKSDALDGPIPWKGVRPRGGGAEGEEGVEDERGTEDDKDRVVEDGGEEDEPRASAGASGPTFPSSRGAAPRSVIPADGPGPNGKEDRTVGPERRSVSGGPIGVWPSQRDRIPTWAEAEDSTEAGRASAAGRHASRPDDGGADDGGEDADKAGGADEDTADPEDPAATLDPH